MLKPSELFLNLCYFHPKKGMLRCNWRSSSRLLSKISNTLEGAEKIRKKLVEGSPSSVLTLSTLLISALGVWRGTTAGTEKASRI